MTSIIIALSALAATAMLSMTALAAWRGWLDLRRAELTRSIDPQPTQPPVGLRIELTDVKERLRRLEAIANGVEL